MRALLLLLLILYASEIALAQSDEILSVGAGVTPPKLLRKVEPTYTDVARNALVQGTALFEVVVGTNGRLRDIAVVSPIGFGLDERAAEAMKQWEFEPAQKEGKPVNVRANIEVNFRFPEIWYDAKQEKRRTQYNQAARNLQQSDPKTVQRAVETIQDLSKQRFPPATYLHAVLLREGKLLSKDPVQSLALLSFAAEKNYGPAVYEMGRMYLEGQDLPLDRNRGLRLIHEAAVAGSAGAQAHLGAMYEAGVEAPRDLPRARRYFRLCAAGNQPECQVRLARLLLNQSPRADRDYIQAIAWLQLASDAGQPQAKALLAQEAITLTDDQKAWATKLKAQLVRRS